MPGRVQPPGAGPCDRRVGRRRPVEVSTGPGHAGGGGRVAAGGAEGPRLLGRARRAGGRLPREEDVAAEARSRVRRTAQGAGQDGEGDVEGTGRTGRASTGRCAGGPVGDGAAGRAARGDGRAVRRRLRGGQTRAGGAGLQRLGAAGLRSADAARRGGGGCAGAVSAGARGRIPGHLAGAGGDPAGCGRAEPGRRLPPVHGRRPQAVDLPVPLRRAGHLRPDDGRLRRRARRPPGPPRGEFPQPQRRAGGGERPVRAADAADAHADRGVGWPGLRRGRGAAVRLPGLRRRRPAGPGGRTAPAGSRRGRRPRPGRRPRSRQRRGPRAR
ncbi:MAG: hypothetical protein BIFFINMI_03750 [Phycisphaerae bacterium]|nr:hypothetical protein [Phycisphaerae bacterium]